MRFAGLLLLNKSSLIINCTFPFNTWKLIARLDVARSIYSIKF